MKKRTVLAGLLAGSALVTGCRGEVLLQEQPAGEQQGASASPASSSQCAAPASTAPASTAPAIPSCVAGVAPGSPLPLPALPSVFSIAADDAYVYVSTYEQQNGVVTRISPQDCSTIALNPSGLWGFFAVDGTSVYSPALPSYGGNSTVISVCARTGCAGGSSTLATGDVWGVAVDGNFIYFTPGASNASPGVSRIPVGGGSVTALAPDDSAFALVVAGGKVIYATSPFEVKSVPIGGGAASNFYSAPGAAGTNSLVADSANVYLAVNDGNIVRVPLAGGQPTTIASGQGAGVSLAIDSENLYWGASDQNGTIRKMALCGGPVIDLGTADPPASGVAVSGAYVYFASGGEVYAVRK